nr:CPBP family intramembrane metalloprotease [Anaerolineae bacterium]
MTKTFWNEKEGRLRTAWRLLIQALLTIGLALAVMLLPVFRAGPGGEPHPYADMIRYPLWMVIALAVVWFAGHYLDRRHFHDFGLHLHRRAFWLDVIFGAALGVMTTAPLILIGALSGFVSLEKTYQTGAASIPLWLATLLWALTYLSIGIFEELARAYQVRNLLEGVFGASGSRRQAVMIAVIGSSLFSALLHGPSPIYMLFVVLSTGVLAVAYLLTGRIGIAIAYHAVWDFMLSVMLALNTGDVSPVTAFYTVRPDGPLLAAHAGSYVLLGFAVVIMELLKLLAIIGWVRWREGRAGADSSLFTRSPG